MLELTPRVKDRCFEQIGRNMQIETLAVETLRPYARNARTHSNKQIRQIATSIERFGFNNPVLIDDQGQIIAGHGRVAAAKLLGIKEVPTVKLAHLSEVEKRAYILADNRLAEKAGWDREILAIELQALVSLDFQSSLPASKPPRLISSSKRRPKRLVGQAAAKTGRQSIKPVLRSPVRATCGSLDPTASSARMRGTPRHTFGCWAVPKPSSCSPILPTTSRSMATFVGSAGSGTPTLPWVAAR
jgi:hypothetical protein